MREIWKSGLFVLGCLLWGGVLFAQGSGEGSESDEPEVESSPSWDQGALTGSDFELPTEGGLLPWAQQIDEKLSRGHQLRFNGQLFEYHHGNLQEGYVVFRFFPPSQDTNQFRNVLEVHFSRENLVDAVSGYLQATEPMREDSATVFENSENNRVMVDALLQSPSAGVVEQNLILYQSYPQGLLQKNIFSTRFPLMEGQEGLMLLETRVEIPRQSRLEALWALENKDLFP